MESSRTMIVMHGGGTAACESHTGVLKALEEEIPFFRQKLHLQGASAAAIIAALYSSDYDALRLEAMIRSTNLDDWFVANPFEAVKSVFGLSNYLFDNTGLLKQLRLRMKARAMLSVMVSMTRMRDHRPVLVPAMPDTVLASTAIPMLFPPVEIEGELYYDGGVLNNVPMPSQSEIDTLYDHVYVLLTPFSYPSIPRNFLDRLVDLIGCTMDREVHQINESYTGHPKITILQPPPYKGASLLAWSPGYGLIDHAYRYAKKQLGGAV